MSALGEFRVELVRQVELLEKAESRDLSRQVERLRRAKSNDLTLRFPSIRKRLLFPRSFTHRAKRLAWLLYHNPRSRDYRRELFRKALAEASANGMGPTLLPIMEAALQQHEAMLASVCCGEFMDSARNGLVAIDRLVLYLPPRTALTEDPKRGPQSTADKYDLLAATLIKWHEYSFDHVDQYEPITVTELANKANVSKSTASKFFTKAFGGHKEYQANCRSRNLSKTLAVLAGETPAAAKRHEQTLIEGQI